VVTARGILGLQIPDEGVVFYAALVAHVAAALVALVAGVLAATARKRPGRHPRAGRVYLCGLAVVTATAAVMTAIRFRPDAHLLAIGVISLGLGLFGRRARRRRQPGWPVRHAVGMGGSFIGLLTAFYIDNGPQLPVWNRLPHWTYWALPTTIGAALIWWALRRFAAGASTLPRTRGRRPSASQ
jgi:hypothetical protein